MRRPRKNCKRFVDADPLPAQVVLAWATVAHHQHPTACVDEGAIIGDDTRVWHFAHVSAGARVGRRCVLGQNVYVAPGVTVGDGVRVQNNVSLYTGVTVEDEVFLGPSCVFTNVANPRAAFPRKHDFRPTVIRRGATVGANATVVCGHEIGAYAMVGAGAVVTRDVPPHALVVGVPARRIGWVCTCGERLALDEAAPAPALDEPACAHVDVLAPPVNASPRGGDEDRRPADPVVPAPAATTARPDGDDRRAACPCGRRWRLQGGTLCLD